MKLLRNYYSKHPTAGDRFDNMTQTPNDSQSQTARRLDKLYTPWWI